jgi:hypothetical protein
MCLHRKREDDSHTGAVIVFIERGYEVNEKQKIINE